mgnify:CR=1 FL=1
MIQNIHPFFAEADVQVIQPLVLTVLIGMLWYPLSYVDKSPMFGGSNVHFPDYR